VESFEPNVSLLRSLKERANYCIATNVSPGGYTMPYMNDTLKCSAIVNCFPERTLYNYHVTIMQPVVVLHQEVNTMPQ
jgi:hypothetical protein